MPPETHVSNALAPTIVVVFGVTGDLMAKKIAPALFHLFAGGLLPVNFKVVGVARREFSHEAFGDLIMDALFKYSDVEKYQQKLRPFVKNISYTQGDFGTPETYSRLAAELKSIDDAWGMCSNKLFYLAVPPENYETILSNLAESKLTEPCSAEEGWTRVVVEKPFGKDLKTAQRLDTLLGTLFNDVQVYRMDHYLGKEMLQNILSFRFSNHVFMDSWDADSVEKIEIRLFEKDGIRDRGNFYDGVGAFRDVGQNHLLQMLALVTMGDPGVFSSGPIRARRAEILRELRTMTPEEIEANTMRGQYRGYRDVAGVAPDSKTETYFKIQTFLDTPRWRGVPIVLESGKGMPEQKKEIVVTFARPQSSLCFGHLPEGGANTITFHLEPREGITVRLFGKKPGLTMEIEEKQFKFFSDESAGKKQYAEEYEKLLLDVIRGDQTLFVSTDEILSMWRFSDPIVSEWMASGAGPIEYDADISKLTLKNKTEVPPSASVSQRHELGIIGLGKMGGGIARQLARKGWSVTGFDMHPLDADTLVEEGVSIAASVADMVSHLKSSPKIVWLMVPAGKIVDQVIAEVAPLLSRGDIIIDGGNSYYKDAIKRAESLRAHGISYLDAGTSGGPGGALMGASIMIGGERAAFLQAEHVFRDLSVRRGYEFFDGAGAGHFVKMIHNGIEYGMMQAIAEGFHIMRQSPFKLDLSRIAAIYNHGTVIESRLIGWLSDAYDLYSADLTGITGTVAHTGEGSWTVKTAEELGVKAKVIEESLKFREESSKDPNYTGQVLSALRNRFGGHSAK